MKGIVSGLRPAMREGYEIQMEDIGETDHGVR